MLGFLTFSLKSLFFAFSRSMYYIKMAIHTEDDESNYATPIMTAIGTSERGSACFALDTLDPAAKIARTTS